MTIETVNQFLTKVNQDGNLQTELSQAMSTEDKYQATTELAAKYGYEFTPEELSARIEELESVRAKESANEELSEEELEAVAGGVCTPLFTAGAAAGARTSVVSAASVSGRKIAPGIVGATVAAAGATAAGGAAINNAVNG